MGKAESSFLFLIFFVDDLSPLLPGLPLGRLPCGPSLSSTPSSFSSLSNFAACCRWWPDNLQI